MPLSVCVCVDLSVCGVCKCVCMWVHKHAFCTASPDQNEWVGKGGGEIRASLRGG